MIKYNDEYVCFILVNGYGSVKHKDEPEGWIIWTDDSGKVDWFADFPLDEHTKEIAWANVDFCGHCGGSCDGGFHKTIFGKEFDNVCNTTFRFDNPNAKAIESAKKLVELRKTIFKGKPIYMDRIVHNAVWIETGSMNMREYCAINKL